jgi:hypothetical protein
MTTFDAEAWARAGVSDAAEARSWHVAGVTPDEVAGWRAAGIGFAEAAAWREFGYSLEQAREAKRRGRKPSDAFRRRLSRQPQPSAMSALVPVNAAVGLPEMQTFLERIRRKHPELLHGYFQRRWLDDEAVALARAGIDAGEALLWKEFGVAPAEAARLAKAGREPASELRSWWEAGIPPDEVAAWLGAGLTAEEAAEQRTRGVSAEAAAVMRALRDPGADA